MADEIAEKVGIFTDSDYRIRAGLLYILLQASANGHTYLPQKELFSQATELLKVETTAMEKHLMDMQMDKRLVIRERKQQKTAENNGKQSTFSRSTAPSQADIR